MRLVPYYRVPRSMAEAESQAKSFMIGGAVLFLTGLAIYAAVSAVKAD